MVLPKEILLFGILFLGLNYGGQEKDSCKCGKSHIPCISEITFNQMKIEIQGVT
jgi:hypothetical protein